MLLDTNGEPRVTDFGLAKQVDTDAELTASGQMLGTTSYMPPEHGSGRTAEIGPRADVYPLGAVMCHHRATPFKAESTMDVLMQVLEQEPFGPRQLIQSSNFKPGTFSKC